MGDWDLGLIGNVDFGEIYCVIGTVYVLQIANGA